MRPVSSIALWICSLSIGFAQALPRSDWAVEVGGFLSDFDTSLRLSGPNGGTEINLEDTLGLDTNDSTFRGSLVRRFGERHMVSVGFYKFNRTASATSARTIIIDREDQTVEFDAGATIRTGFDWQLVPIVYTYAFHSTDRFEAGLNLGVHWADVDASFSGEAVINGQPVASATEAESSSAPLPVFGLQAQYAATDNIVLSGSANYFGLEFDDVSGDLTDIRLTAKYYWTPRISTGLGYTWYSINYTDQEGRYRFDLDYSYDGLEGFLTWRF